jgi:hypothetical protein
MQELMLTALGCMQVAAYADHHILVSKAMHDGRADTNFRVLEDRQSRVAEVATMMDVDTAVAEKLLKHAEAARVGPGKVLREVGSAAMGSPERVEAQELGGHPAALSGYPLLSTEPVHLNPGDTLADGVVHQGSIRISPSVLNQKF